MGHHNDYCARGLGVPGTKCSSGLGGRATLPGRWSSRYCCICIVSRIIKVGTFKAHASEYHLGNDLLTFLCNLRQQAAAQVLATAI